MKTIILLCTLCFSACTLLPQSHDPVQFIKARELIDEGVLEMRAGNLDKAWATYELSYDIMPTAESIDGMGCIAMMKGDLQAAQKLFLAAYDADNNYAPALEHLALLYEQQGFKEEALTLYNQALELDPTLVRARNNRAVFMYEIGLADKEQVNSELFKAQKLLQHPEIVQNINKIK